jgi:hypothetical protein
MSVDIPRSPTRPGRLPQLHDLRELDEEPAIDLRGLVEVLDAPPALERAEHGPHAAVGRHAQIPLERAFFLLLRQSLACPRILTEQLAA